MKLKCDTLDVHISLIYIISVILIFGGILVGCYRNRYFITFIDDCSRFTHVYLLKHKAEAFNAFKIYKAEMENQLSKRIKVLRSDRGGEYFST